MRSLRYKFFVLGFISLLVTSCSSTSSVTQTQDSQSAQPLLDDSWVPTNFSKWSDEPPLAVRVLDFNKGEYDCGYSDRCFGIMVIAKNGCNSNLYAEVSLLDKDGVQIGYTNDSLPSALPMQKSKMIFTTYEKGVSRFQVSRISCL
jgi:hypothetical protein